MNGLIATLLILVVLVKSSSTTESRLIKREEPTKYYFFTESGSKLIDTPPSDSLIGWYDIDPDPDQWTNGVFNFLNCTGALIKTWDNEEAPPPEDAPAYAVASGFCFRPVLDTMLREKNEYNLNTKNLTIYNTTQDITVVFNSYAKYAGSKLIKAEVLEVPIISLQKYSIAILKLNYTALELHNMNLTFYGLTRKEDLPQEPFRIKTVTYRTDLTTRYLKLSEGTWRSTTTSSWTMFYEYWMGSTTIRPYYFNKYAFSADTNYHAIGSPSFDFLSGQLLYLVDELKQRKIAGTRVDWLRPCFENNIWTFFKFDCLPEWKVAVFDEDKMEFEGYADAKKYLDENNATPTLTSTSTPTPSTVGVDGSGNQNNNTKPTTGEGQHAFTSFNGLLFSIFVLALTGIFAL